MDPLFKPIEIKPVVLNPLDNILPKIEVAPIVHNFIGGATFKGSGDSHFTFDKNGYHVTTNVPNLNLGLDFGVKIKNDVSDFRL